MISQDADPLVVDANIAVWSVLPSLAATDTRRLFERWTRQQRDLVVPSLWLAEVTTAIRTAVFDNRLSATEGEQALNSLMTLNVSVMPITPALCLAAFQWAARLRQRRAYDAFYVALAEELGCEFWTTDERLYFAARQQGASWVQRLQWRK